MWIRRWRRRRQQPPPLVLPPLERLAELVERVVVLLDQAPAPPPEAVVDERPQAEAEAEGEGHVLFVPSPAGYRLVERAGPAPGRAEVLELDVGRCRVLRVGRSPLPGDRRPCAFLDQEAIEQEPLEQNRTPTGDGGEPDRGHAGGTPGGS